MGQKNLSSIMDKVYEDIEKHTILDKKVLAKVNKERCVIGKELLICEQMHLLHAKLSNKELRNQLILYLILLFKNNNQVYESLKRELEDDKKRLVKRIEKEFKKDKVHKELYNSILSVADEHFKTGKNHVEQYDETDKKTHHHAHMALHHKTKAEELYDILLAKDVRKVLKHLALTKFSEVCEKLIENSEEIAANIQKAADYAEKNKTGEELNNCLYHINHKVLEQNLVLRHFALSYSKALIHSAEFLDSQSDKIILYVHK